MLIKALGLKCMSMIQKERERDEIEVKERITHIEKEKKKTVPFSILIWLFTGLFNFLQGCLPHDQSCKNKTRYKFFMFF